MNRLRSWARRVLPLSIRQSLAHARRCWCDRGGWNHLLPVRSDDDLGGYFVQCELRQEIKTTELFANKLTNIRQGARCVNRALIRPGQTWSFWQYVRRPTEGNGYEAGRSLVDGRLTRQVGGGLCQLSSLIYHLGLLAGLNIVERHAHSFDIYQEHERFTPLGSDATVVWGFKDLRMENPYHVDLVIECLVEGHCLVGRIYAAGKLPQYQVAFVRERIDDRCVLVKTMVNERMHTQTRYFQKCMKLNDT